MNIIRPRSRDEFREVSGDGGGNPFLCRVLFFLIFTTTTGYACTSGVRYKIQCSQGTVHELSSLSLHSAGPQ